MRSRKLYVLSHVADWRQVLEGRSHALLQESGVDLVAILQEEGFYVTRRQLSAPGVTRRTRESFGTSSAIELPTRTEFDKLSERWACFHLLSTAP